MKREFTTLCYLQKDGKWLMLYRNKKKNPRLLPIFRKQTGRRKE